MKNNILNTKYDVWCQVLHLLYPKYMFSFYHVDEFTEIWYYFLSRESESV